MLHTDARLPCAVRVSCVQATHRKTFLYLEQLILKHKAHLNSLSIKEQQGVSPLCNAAMYGSVTVDLIHYANYNNCIIVRLVL